MFPKRIISVFQRQLFIARLKLPAVAAVILGAALGANGVAVFVDHQPGQYAQGNGVRSGLAFGAQSSNKQCVSFVSPNVTSIGNNIA